jgi:hypothetical protein
MANLSETDVYPDGIYQIENGDPPTGGAEGVANAQAIGLANRTRNLRNRLEVLETDSSLSARLGPEMPIAALPYPCVATADNRLGVGTGSGANGGTVSIASGQRLSLAMELEAGYTARLGYWITAAWTSAGLDVSSTYYLRAQIDDDALLFYVVKGSDSDAIPGSLRGTPGAASGGGFDSTRLDMLVAKVVTGTAGSAPTVTPLRNTDRLFANVVESGTPTLGSGYSYFFTHTINDLNWARIPQTVVVTGHVVSSLALSGQYLQGGANNIDVSQISRYGLIATCISDWSAAIDAPSANLRIALTA